jgi:hypothetical protein
MHFVVKQMHRSAALNVVWPLQEHALQFVRGYAAKDVRFGVGCRAAVLAGVEKLSDAVAVTLGPKASLVYFPLECHLSSCFCEAPRSLCLVNLVIQLRWFPCRVAVL